VGRNIPRREARIVLLGDCQRAPQHDRAWYKWRAGVVIIRLKRQVVRLLEFFERYRFAFVEFCHCDSYLMTLSARASTLGGIVRPICLAVFKLITSSNFVGCSMGRSAGLAPLRILST
jgi:hypothetical protein